MSTTLSDDWMSYNCATLLPDAKKEIECSIHDERTVLQPDELPLIQSCILRILKISPNIMTSSQRTGIQKEYMNVRTSQLANWTIFNGETKGEFKLRNWRAKIDVDRVKFDLGSDVCMIAKTAFEMQVDASDADQSPIKTLDLDRNQWKLQSTCKIEKKRNSILCEDDNAQIDFTVTTRTDTTTNHKTTHSSVEVELIDPSTFQNSTFVQFRESTFLKFAEKICRIVAELQCASYRTRSAFLSKTNNPQLLHHFGSLGNSPVTLCAASGRSVQLSRSADMRNDFIAAVKNDGFPVCVFLMMDDKADLTLTVLPVVNRSKSGRGKQKKKKFPKYLSLTANMIKPEDQKEADTNHYFPQNNTTTVFHAEYVLGNDDDELPAIIVTDLVRYIPNDENQGSMVFGDDGDLRASMVFGDRITLANNIIQTVTNNNFQIVRHWSNELPSSNTIRIYSKEWFPLCRIQDLFQTITADWSRCPLRQREEGEEEEAVPHGGIDGIILADSTKTFFQSKIYKAKQRFQQSMDLKLLDNGHLGITRVPVFTFEVEGVDISFSPPERAVVTFGSLGEGEEKKEDKYLTNGQIVEVSLSDNSEWSIDKVRTDKETSNFSLVILSGLFAIADNVGPAFLRAISQPAKRDLILLGAVPTGYNPFMSPIIRADDNHDLLTLRLLEFNKKYNLICSTGELEDGQVKFMSLGIFEKTSYIVRHTMNLEGIALNYPMVCDYNPEYGSFLPVRRAHPKAQLSTFQDIAEFLVKSPVPEEEPPPPVVFMMDDDDDDGGQNVFDMLRKIIVDPNTIDSTIAKFRNALDNEFGPEE